MSMNWRGTGPAFELTGWGGRDWGLSVDGERPGLRAPDGSFGPLLALDGLGASGRSDPKALAGSSLVDFETHRGAVRATYAPVGWGDLKVRATWSLGPDDSVDLEVQAWALSVGELTALAVFVASAGAAGLGAEEVRDPKLGPSTIGADGPVADRWGVLAPVRFRASGAGGPDYVEFAQARDVARRGRTLQAGPGTAGEVRSALFGHDLEKGVVLRARLRGLWVPATAGAPEIADACGRFLAEPPPLGP